MLVTVIRLKVSRLKLVASAIGNADSWKTQPLHEFCLEDSTVTCVLTEGLNCYMCPAWRIRLLLVSCLKDSTVTCVLPEGLNRYMCPTWRTQFLRVSCARRIQLLHVSCRKDSILTCVLPEGFGCYLCPAWRIQLFVCPAWRTQCSTPDDTSNEDVLALTSTSDLHSDEGLLPVAFSGSTQKSQISLKHGGHITITS